MDEDTEKLDLIEELEMWHWIAHHAIEGTGDRRRLRVRPFGEVAFLIGSYACFGDEDDDD